MYTYINECIYAYLQMLALTSFVHLAKPLSSQATCVSPMLLNTLTHSRTLLSPLKAHSDAPSLVSHTLSHAVSTFLGWLSYECVRLLVCGARVRPSRLWLRRLHHRRYGRRLRRVHAKFHPGGGASGSVKVNGILL